MCVGCSSSWHMSAVQGPRWSGNRPRRWKPCAPGAGQPHCQLRLAVLQPCCRRPAPAKQDLLRSSHPRGCSDAAHDHACWKADAAIQHDGQAACRLAQAEAQQTLAEQGQRSLDCEKQELQQQRDALTRRWAWIFFDLGDAAVQLALVHL